MNKNTIKGIFLMLLCSFFFCFGQFIWKLMFGLNWSYLLLGFAVFGCGAVLMIFAYRYGELSILQPINSMSYVYALFLGYVFFHEEITFFKAIGVVVIISGILLLSRASTP